VGEMRGWVDVLGGMKAGMVAAMAEAVVAWSKGFAAGAACDDREAVLGGGHDWRALSMASAAVYESPANASKSISTPNAAHGYAVSIP